MPPIEAAAEPTLTDLAGLLAPEPDNEEAADDTGGEQPDAGDGDQGEDGNPEGTDAEGADEGDGGDEGTDAEAGEGEPNTEPSYTVKVDGKDVRVTLKEALAGYQRGSDYTRKTQEVAEQRKQFEAETGAARQQRDQYAAVLKLVQDRLGPADQEPTAEQWNALRQSDPARYATEYTDYQRRNEQRAAVKAEQDRVAGENRSQDLQKARTYLDGERTKLVAAIPELGDKDKGPAKLKSLREYAGKTFGWTEAEMDQAYDHRMIVAIDKAAKWDAHNAAIVAAKTKVKQAPQLPAPGPRVPGKSPKAAARAQSQKQFDKSGRIEDAVDLLLG